MKYSVTYRLRCELIIPDRKRLEIGGFIFLPEFERGQVATQLQTEVEARTREEAQRKAHTLCAQFLAKLQLVEDMQFTLSGVISIKEGSVTTMSKDFCARAPLGVDGSVLKDKFEQSLRGKHLRIRPLSHYAAGINATDPFVKFRNFYLVLELYLGPTRQITAWIKGKMPNIEMRNDEFGHPITVLSWIRHKLSHAKKERKGLEPLLISNPQHVALVQKHTPIVQNLAREIIREREKV